MKFVLIALKTLKRKKIRTCLTLSGVAIAVAVMVSLLGFDRGYQKALQGDMDKMGYQLLVTAKGCPYEAATLMLKGGGGLKYMDEAVFAKIVKDPRIENITPQLVATAYDPDRGEGAGGIAMYMGIDDSYLKLKPWSKFKTGGWFTSPDADEVIMGYEAAELEQRHVGDEVFVPGKEKILKVVGIMERIGTQDDGIIFMPLKTTQRIFNTGGKITGIGVKLKDIADITKFEEDLYNEPGIQVISMAEVKGTIFNLMSSAKTLTNSIAAIAIIIALIGVINTILMSVFERTKDIGVMKALGASKLDIFQIIWLETTLICAIGGILGDILAVLGGVFVEKLIKSILPYAPSGHLVDVTPDLLVYSIIGAVLTGLIAGIYPAWRACTMRPVQAIRSAG